MKISKKVLIVLILLGIAGAGTAGYLLLPKKGKGADTKQVAKAELYTCSMHPFIIKDKPGSCPICGMTLVKKIEGAATDPKIQQAVGHVSLSPTQQLMANVATAEAKMQTLSREIMAVGIVTYDQARQGKVTAWVAGRLDKLYVNRVGDYVTAGKPVASVYSPDLVAAQQEYLLALRSRDQFKNSSFASIAAGGEGLVSSARQRLKLLGVKDAQISQLEKTGNPDIKLNIYTPVSGVVIEKMMQEGQYVNMGEVLFNVADLSSVWVELEVYENDFPSIKLGHKVEIISQSYPGKTFVGTVSYIYPFLDPKTRTVKVRVSLPNSGMKLKPDMYVNATVKAPLGAAVVVPVAAVMDTGKRKVVWVETSPGMFEPRDVQTGGQSGDLVQILSGVKAGEKVASSGGYLIDSESQLNAGGAQDHSQHTGKKPAEVAPGGAAGAGHSNHGAQSGPAKKKSDIDMSDMKM